MRKYVVLFLQMQNIKRTSVKKRIEIGKEKRTIPHTTIISTMEVDNAMIPAQYLPIRLCYYYLLIYRQ